MIVFNFFHKFKFEGGGIRIWRAYAIGQGRLIPYQDFIVKPQGPTGLVVNENLESSGEQQHEHGASSSSSDLQLGWALHKPRSEAVRFTCEVKLYLSTKSDLAERTGMKADPGKVAAYMRMIRNPDSSRMFERKDWLTSLKIGGCKKETGKPRS